jgi:DNA invertase Pin-like site-specific DNA recombinase
MTGPWKDGRLKLTNADVIEAFRLRASGLTCAAIARRLGVGRSTIGNILNRRERAGVAVPPEYLSPARRRPPPHAPVPEAVVVEMFRLRASGLTQAEVATGLGVKLGTVAPILARHSRAGVAIPREYLECARRPKGAMPGERNPNARLGTRDVEDAFRLAAAGEPVAAIAARFGVMDSTIRDVLDRKTWRHVVGADESLAPRR